MDLTAEGRSFIYKPCQMNSLYAIDSVSKFKVKIQSKDLTKTNLTIEF